MNDLASKTPAKPPGGEGGTPRQRTKRKKYPVRDIFRCRAHLPNGRRCFAAAIQHDLYCVFHSPEIQARRRRLADPVPYEYPEDVQRLLGEVIDAAKKGKLASKQANAVGYLATLLMQNQPRVEKEKDWMKALPESTETNALYRQIWLDHLKARPDARSAEEARSPEDDDTPERD